MAITGIIEALPSHIVVPALAVAAVLVLLYRLAYPLLASPLRSIPGPTAYALTKWRLAWDDWQGRRTRTIDTLHKQYGPVVRVGPDEVSFASLSALRTIYGAGSGFERTTFYRMFDVYGRQNLFTFAEVKRHAARKKLLAHAYAKTTVLSPAAIAKPLIERNVQSFLDLVAADQHPDSAQAGEIFRSLHWFSLDSITGFLYGDAHGGTHALRGHEGDRALLHDIVDPRRRQLSWFAVHLRGLNTWLYTRTGWAEAVVTRLGLLPMRKPATYTGIRAHALQAWADFDRAKQEGAVSAVDDLSIVGKLWRLSRQDEKLGLDGLSIASEAADHFLAGIDTTSDTLTFILWSLSRPELRAVQDRLVAEVDAIPAHQLNADGNPVAEAADSLPYVNAVIKEALRMYAPLPGSEPRASPVDTTIDGFPIPKGTVVSMGPYTLHNNLAVFPEPEKFKPERWLGQCGDLAEMKKWFWAFSSGGRMCIGMHLAMAEMTTFLAALYRRYNTALQDKQKGATPGITSRYELIGDGTFDRITEHECWIRFEMRCHSAPT